MNTITLSIVHRLPRHYRWASGGVGVQVEPIPEPEAQSVANRLIGLTLLSQRGATAWQVMRDMYLSLREVQVVCFLVALDDDPCLLVAPEDESTVICRLKDAGVVIAEPILAHAPG